MTKKPIKGVSLFSGAGIGETYLNECGIDIRTANELIPQRAELYRAIYPECDMICGDITNNEIFERIIESAKDSKFLLASPPCQGFSVAGKNRVEESIVKDERNLLFNWVIKAIEVLSPDAVLIENVPTLLKCRLPHNGELKKIDEILADSFGGDYVIESKIVDAADYGVPQTRLRAIVKLYKKSMIWPWPEPEEKKVTVREAIGDLPSLEAGERSEIKWHFARPHSEYHIEMMKNTATGTSAFENSEYFPKKPDGTKVKGFHSSYRRIKWDEPAPTITIRNDAISSQRNVHPGRLKPDGTYSDARVLTPYELMILSSLPTNWPIPDDTSEILIRQVIGESIPPLMIKKIVGELKSR